MKKFLIRTLMTFSIMFIFFFICTMTIEYINKDKINTTFNLETEIEDGKIIVPEEPLKVQANYEFTKFYFYTGLVVSFFMPILFYKFGGIDLVKNLNLKKKILEGSILYILYRVFSDILYFPRSLFGSYYRGHLFGISNQNFFDFLENYFFSDGIIFLIMIPIIGVLYYIFISRKNWYKFFAVLLILLSIGGNYLYPYFDEFQNDLQVMEDGELKDKIIEIAKEAGIDNLDIYVIEKSKETNSLNAYMTGIFNSRRIVFWDTTLNGLSEKEILSVAAHEMGHYKLNHILQETIISIFGIVVFLFVLNKILLIRKGEKYRKIDNIPYILVTMNIIVLLITPIETAYSRYNETQADKFAMEVTNDGYTNGILEISFINNNLTPVNPKGLYKWLSYDHPTVKERIEICNEYENGK